MAGSAAVMDLDGGGNCSYARVALFGVDATPVRAREVEDALLGNQCSPKLIKEAAAAVRGIIDPETDVHVTAEYRRNAAQALTVRALEDALSRAITE